MRIAKTYSHLGGAEILSVRFPDIDRDINEVIGIVDSPRTKESREKNMMGRMLYSPKDTNATFKKHFAARGFREMRLDYSLTTAAGNEIRAYKQIDFNKDVVNVEVQFGKYAFMFYDLSKFQHFYMERKIDVGVEIVPTHRMMKEMSSGVSYGEQLEFDIIRLERAFPSVPIKIIMIEP